MELDVEVLYAETVQSVQAWTTDVNGDDVDDDDDDDDADTGLV